MKKQRHQHSHQRISVDQAMQMALQVHRGGQPRQAVEHYRAILQVAPEHPDALHYLGIAQHQLGQRDDAIRLLQRALAIAPGYTDARNNLGNMQKESGRFAEAEQSYRSVIAERPDFAPAHGNLGVVLKEQGDYQAAAQAYRHAVKLAPDFVEGWINLGHLLKKLDQQDDALSAYRNAVMLQPDNIEALRGVARSLAAFGRLAEALEVYRQWEKLEPGNPVVQHHIAACSGQSAPQRASDAYVQQTFDRFAETFDKVLAGLEYRAPALCGELVARLLDPAQLQSRSLRVLDAGCGTGLCGPILRPLAQRLHGVDLSPAMLAKAQTRGDYDALDAAELTAWLAGHPQAYDLIVSADTLCYFGVLDAAIGAAAASLRSGGHLVFTVEQTLPECLAQAPAFKLHGHGRYSHAESYVRQTLAAAGLEIREISTVALRNENKKPVGGLLVGARRP